MNISFENLNSVESCILKGCEKAFFSERAGNAAAPKLRIILHLLRHVFITDNVADNGATTFFEHAEDFFEQPPFRFRFYEVENTIGNDHISGITRDKRLLHASDSTDVVVSNCV